MPASTLSSNKPYLFRAMYEWINDNECTPYIIVDAQNTDAIVPQKYVNEGRIILNIAVSSVRKLKMTNDYTSFEARFEGKWLEIFVPMDAILAVYAQENGQGMVFDAGMPADASEPMDIEMPADEDESEPMDIEAPAPVKGKPFLRVVK